MNTAVIEMDYPVVEVLDNSGWHSHNDVWERLENKFNAHYGTDCTFDYHL
jgi:hypothetical protein